MEVLKKRKNVICAILGIVLILEIGGLFYNSGIISGVNERADKLKVFTVALCDDATILPGDIFDRNGKVLAETIYKTEIEKKEEK